MSTLVVYASKHGSTKAIAEQITRTLEQQGIQQVTLVSAKDAGKHLATAKNVIVGAPVYMDKWLSAGSLFLEENLEKLKTTKLFIFAVGGGEVCPEHVSNGLANYEPLAQEYFRGALVQGELNLFERLILKIVHSQYGDFRNWKHIEEWAAGIATQLR